MEVSGIDVTVDPLVANTRPEHFAMMGANKFKMVRRHGNYYIHVEEDWKEVIWWKDGVQIDTPDKLKV